MRLSKGPEVNVWHLLVVVCRLFLKQNHTTNPPWKVPEQMLVSTTAYLHWTEQRCVCINFAFPDIPSICCHREELILQKKMGHERGVPGIFRWKPTWPFLNPVDVKWLIGKLWSRCCSETSVWTVLLNRLDGRLEHHSRWAALMSDRRSWWQNKKDLKVQARPLREAHGQSSPLSDFILGF